MADKNFVVKNGLTVNNNFIANSSQFSLGANLVINTSSIFIGNSSVNLSVNATMLTINTGSFINVYANTINTTSINSAIYSIGATFVANTTGIYHTGTINAASYTTGDGVGGGGVTINTTAIAIGNSTVNTYIDIGGASTPSQTLSDAATISWDVSKGKIAQVTIGASRTMAAPTNLKPGYYTLQVIQGAGGGFNITWNSVFKWPAAIAPVLTAAAGSRDILTFVSDGTNLYGTYVNDVR